MFKRRATAEDHERRERGQSLIQDDVLYDASLIAEAAWWHRADAQVLETLRQMSPNLSERVQCRDVIAYFSMGGGVLP